MIDNHESPPRNGEVAAQPPEGPAAARPVLGAPGKTMRIAKALRQSMTKPEVYLWQRLRGRKGEERWRKQHPCGPYVLDFFNVAGRLCVEVDGFAHDVGGRPTRDEVRDRWLKREGITVVRIAAADVLKAPDEVAQSVLDLAASHRASRGPSDALRAPPPRNGEE